MLHPHILLIILETSRAVVKKHPGQYWDGREWVLDPNLVKTIENLYNNVEAATKSKLELEKDMSCVESPPSGDLKGAAEAGFEAAFYSAKMEKFKAIQQSVFKRAKTGSRSGSSTDGIEERKLLEATKKETIENKQAWDRDTHLASKKVNTISGGEKKVQSYSSQISRSCSDR
ncbi:uncharacterized protein Bfra_003744 [Botrytis fragariae]|uniref:Uncharacterized protein n=1 Tax=Botrytis fragariae TaxID=1964551 RepID=A0A8H6AXP9_9HELO|nr:uncharacterized protein Bfra_003744 [Botrytis fragariae]KAF5875290.1 hypothetical protein Bfra_003744 [Botrytis fragariae]